MKLITELKKPYTEEQRCDFIVEQNHNLGYEVRETETSIQAWGLDDEEIEEQKKQLRISELKQMLSAADFWGQKYLDKEYTEEEWQEKVALRKSWREEIRELEG